MGVPIGALCPDIREAIETHELDTNHNGEIDGADRRRVDERLADRDNSFDNARNRRDRAALRAITADFAYGGVLTPPRNGAAGCALRASLREGVEKARETPWAANVYNGTWPSVLVGAAINGMGGMVAAPILSVWASGGVWLVEQLVSGAEAVEIVANAMAQSSPTGRAEDFPAERRPELLEALEAAWREIKIGRDGSSGAGFGTEAVLEGMMEDLRAGRAPSAVLGARPPA